MRIHRRQESAKELMIEIMLFQLCTSEESNFENPELVSLKQMRNLTEFTKMTDDERRDLRRQIEETLQIKTCFRNFKLWDWIERYKKTNDFYPGNLRKFRDHIEQNAKWERDYAHLRHVDPKEVKVAEAILEEEYQDVLQREVAKLKGLS